MASSSFYHRGMEVRVKTHARTRRATIRVKPPGVVHLLLPRGYRHAEIPALLEKHHTWLVQGLKSVREQQAALLKQAPPAELELRALGEVWSVHYARRVAGERSLRTRKGGRELTVKLADDQSWREVLRRWLMSQARDHLGQRLDELAREFGFNYQKVSVRGQKTRWGSCSSNQTISLNFRLLFLAPEWVRYILIHELCHTQEMNHSAAFWSLVEQCDPDYRTHDKALRRANETLPVWLHGL